MFLTQNIDLMLNFELCFGSCDNVRVTIFLDLAHLCLHITDDFVNTSVEHFVLVAKRIHYCALHFLYVFVYAYKF